MRFMKELLHDPRQGCCPLRNLKSPNGLRGSFLSSVEAGGVGGKALANAKVVSGGVKSAAT